MSRRILALNVLLGLVGALCAAGLIRELLTPLPLPPPPTPRARRSDHDVRPSSHARRLGGRVRPRRVEEPLQPEPVRGAGRPGGGRGSPAAPPRRRDGWPEEPGVPGRRDGQAHLRLRGRRCDQRRSRAVHRRGSRGDRAARWARGGPAAGSGQAEAGRSASRGPDAPRRRPGRDRHAPTGCAGGRRRSRCPGYRPPAAYRHEPTSDDRARAFRRLPVPGVADRRVRFGHAERSARRRPGPRGPATQGRGHHRADAPAERPAPHAAGARRSALGGRRRAARGAVDPGPRPASPSTRGDERCARAAVARRASSSSTSTTPTSRSWSRPRPRSWGSTTCWLRRPGVGR